MENSQLPTFQCNAFTPQAGHWVKLQDGRNFFYQTLNSGAYLSKDRDLTTYIGPGAVIELPALLREIDESLVPDGKLWIAPNAVILQDIDRDFERGLVDLAGNKASHNGTMGSGSTCHGSGAAIARRALRHPSIRLAQDIPRLHRYIKPGIPEEIMSRLDAGECGLLEIAQGWQLSLLHERFFPHVTSRNCSVAQGLSDMMIAPSYAHHVILNFRTYPIRIHDYKYVGEGGGHLTWQEVADGVAHTKVPSPSGGWYPDQHDTTWEQITEDSGSPTPIMECTSVTKLPRKVATWSHMSLAEAVRFNRASGDCMISINFANYLDYAVTGARSWGNLTTKVQDWMRDAISDKLSRKLADLRFIGTGPLTEDHIVL
jgi:adenylosuccinate synthase